MTPKTPRTAYGLLGVAKEASSAEIRHAYRQLARTKHPDQAGSDAKAHEEFLAIKAAYEILIDPNRRAAYDRNPDQLESQIELELRNAQLSRRRRRLRRLYE